MADGLVRTGAGGMPFAATVSDNTVRIPVAETFRGHMLVHLAFQENGAGIFPPGPAEESRSRHARPRQAAAVKDQSVWLGFVCIRRGIPAAAFIHEQGAVFKPAAVTAEYKIHIAFYPAVFKILAALC